MKSMSYLAMPFLAIIAAMLGFVSKNSLDVGSMVPDILFVVSLVTLLVWIGMFHEKLALFFRHKGTKNRFVALGSVILVGAICIGLGMLANRPRFNLSWDTTRDRTNTLSDQSVTVIEKFKKQHDPVRVMAFIESEEEKDRFDKMIGLYQRKMLPVDIEFVDAASDPTKAMSNKVSVANTVIFHYGGNESRITTFSEEKITNALMKLLKAKVKKIYFTKGHGESDTESQEADGLHFLTQDLENNSYSVEELSLLEKGGVPDDAGLVVVAGPKYDFSTAEAGLLNRYLGNGGALLIMMNALKPLETLKSLTKDYGIEINDDLVLLSQEDPRVQLIGQNNAIVSSFDAFSPMTKDFARRSGVAMIMGNTRSLAAAQDNPKHTKVTLVANTLDTMVSISDVRTERDLAKVKPEQIKQGPFAVMALATTMTGGSELAKGEKNSEGSKGDVNVLTESSAAKKVQVVVTGSADFVTNKGVQRHENFDMAMNIVNFLLEDEDFISIRPKAATTSSFDMTAPSSHFNLLLISFVFPFVFLGLGVFLWLRRRSA